MNGTFRLRAALTLSGLLFAAAAGATVESSPVVLAGDGASYRLWSGTFGEVFGENPALPATTPILALDVVLPGQPFQRLLVPGTDGAEIESAPVLLHDPTAQAVHLVWNGRTRGEHPVSRIQLRSFSAAGWSEATQITGGAVSDKTFLRAALEHDEYVTRLDEVETRVARRILHLVWTESLNQHSRAYYTPVVFANGRYLGWNPVIALDELAADDPPSPVVAPDDMRAVPTIQVAGADRVIASFVHSVTQRLVTVEIRAVPAELGELAEMARGHIVALSGTGVERAELAEMARGHIVALAGRFHESAATFLADALKAYLLAAPAEADGATLAEMARGHIVALGRGILDGGLDDPSAGDGMVIELEPIAPAAGTQFGHYFSLRRSSSWELPAGTEAGQTVLVSADGTRAILAREESGRIFYRETVAGGGWSDLRTLDLGMMSSADAWSALARRVSTF